jgi:uncharacterized membrane-anchored protein
MQRVVVLLTALSALAAGAVVHAQAADSQDSGSAAEREFRDKINALHWVSGPTTVSVAGNSTLAIPAGYLFLDAANTSRFEELNENVPSGKEVMVAPKSLQWTAYLLFEESGYVKDNEKIDAPAILKALQEGTERENEERRKRGWRTIHVTGWTIAPAYNTETKRLEWATDLKADDGEGVNFFTKILGRRGVTTVVLATSPDRTAASVADLDKVLTGYQFNNAESYSAWRPGDKVAEYGLAGLIVGGAAAAAAKTGLFKGLFKVILAGAAALWKVILAGVAVVAGAFRSLFKRKSSNP